MKELVYKPIPANLQDLKTKITNTFRNLPESMVARSIYSMKKRAKKMVKSGGDSFEVKKIRL